MKGNAGQGNNSELPQLIARRPRNAGHSPARVCRATPGVSRQTFQPANKRIDPEVAQWKKRPSRQQSALQCTYGSGRRRPHLKGGPPALFWDDDHWGETVCCERAGVTWRISFRHSHALCQAGFVHCVFRLQEIKPFLWHIPPLYICPHAYAPHTCVRTHTYH